MNIPANATTLLFQKAAFERAGLTRAAFDEWLNLTPDEFRVEGELIAVGPVFDTGTKDTGYAAVGLDLIRAVADLCVPAGIPVVAIGGITLARAPSVIAAGATSVCVISDLLTGEPGARARAFLGAVGG